MDNHIVKRFFWDTV